MSLQKIAKECNTSTATVSRVLSGKVKSCQEDGLYEKIWECSARLGYSVNEAARDLRTSNKENNPLTIDVLVSRYANLEEDPFFRELFEIARLEFVRRGFTIGDILTLTDIVSLTRRKSGATTNVPYRTGMDVASIDIKRDTGLLIFGKCQEDIISILEKRYHYIVGIDRNPTDYVYDEVVCEGNAAATLAMEHLISMGHRAIAYVGDCSYESRYIGYYETLLRHKIPLRNEFVFQTSQTRREGFDAAEKILTFENGPTAIFCANDNTALGVIDCIKKHRRKGSSYSVISIDDVDEAKRCSPMLTTVALPKEEMVHMAVNLLNDRRKKGHSARVRINLKGQLIERESVHAI